MTKRAIDAVLAAPWAITDDGMEIVASVAAREHEYAAGNLEALEAKLGRPLANTQRMTIRNGVALLPISGPLFAKANLMTRVSGATSYDTLATDLTTALEDPQVKAIVGVFDTPGGEVTGASELASLVKAARGKKPLVAFIEGQMASAGLWVGSAFDKVVAADTAMIGSLGVQMGIRVQQPAAGEKSYRFISSISPMKNADPGTEAGAAAIQKNVDDLAQVFAGTVAENRQKPVGEVVNNFGQGAMFVAAEAMARGMIDQISTLEAVITDLSRKGTAMDFKSLTAAMLAEHRPDLVAAIGDQAVAAIEKPDLSAIRAEGAAAERQRIQDVRAQSLPGHEALVEQLAMDGKTTGAEAAVKVLAAEREIVAGKKQQIITDAPAPVPTAADEGEGAGATASTAKAPEGFTFSADRAKLDAAAKEYMAANPGVTYLAAVKAVQKGI